MMKIPQAFIEEAHLAFRKILNGWGKQVASSRGVTLREGVQVVKKRIVVGSAGGVSATVALYEVASGEDRNGVSYTKYYGDDRNFYVEDHSTGRIQPV